jgi:hypothetical protein
MIHAQCSAACKGCCGKIEVRRSTTSTWECSPTQTSFQSIVLGRPAPASVLLGGRDDNVTKMVSRVPVIALEDRSLGSRR